MGALTYVGILIWVAGLAVGIGGSVLAARYDDAAWAHVGQPRLLFVVGCALGGALCTLAGLALSGWLYFGLKPRLDAAA